MLVGDAALAHEKLAWRPKIDFATLVERMVNHDLKLEAEKLDRARR